MQGSNFRRTFFDLIICMKLFGFELKTHFFWKCLVLNSKRTFFTQFVLFGFEAKQIRKKVRIEFGTKLFASKGNHGIFRKQKQLKTLQVIL